jgi:hypothetical protein
MQMGAFDFLFRPIFTRRQTPSLKKPPAPPKGQSTGAWDPPLTRKRHAEAKARVYSELALAVTHGVDLATATRTIGYREIHRAIALQSDVFLALHFHERAMLLQFLWQLFLFPFRLLLFVFVVLLPQYVLFAFSVVAQRLFRPEPTMRRIARRLHCYLRSGVPLADAMAACPIDFDSTEVALVRTATQAGNLREVLTGLAQRIESNLRPGYSVAAVVGFYVAVLVSVSLSMRLFIQPKFKDIYDQLCGVPPAQFGVLSEPHFGSSVLILIGAFVIYRAYRNASTGSYWTALIGCALVLMAGILIYNHVSLISALFATPLLTLSAFHSPSESFANAAPVTILGGLITGTLVLFLARGILRRIGRTETFRNIQTSVNLGGRTGTLRKIFPSLSGRAGAELDVLRTVQAGLAGRLPESKIATCLALSPAPFFQGSLARTFDLVESGSALLPALADSRTLTGIRAERVAALPSDDSLPQRLRRAIEDLEEIEQVRRRRLDDQLKIFGYGLIGGTVFLFLADSYGVLFGIPNLVSR